MSDTALVSLFTMIPLAIAAIASLIVAIRTGRKVEAVIKATDGMKDELVRATRGEALQEGHAAGVIDEKIHQRNKPKVV